MPTSIPQRWAEPPLNMHACSPSPSPQSRSLVFASIIARSSVASCVRGAIINTEHQTNRNHVEAAVAGLVIYAALRTLIILKTVENRNKETLSHVKNQSDSTWSRSRLDLECAHTHHAR